MFEQRDFNFIYKYFIAEKQESLLFLVVGIAAIILAVVYFFFIKTNLNEATFTLHNILGQELFKKEITKGENYLEMNIAKGIYYYFIEEENVKLQSGKMVVE